MHLLKSGIILLIALCGCRSTTLSDPKLIGGEVAQVGQYPATINLSLPTASGSALNFCTGAFITKTHILTAAHCVFELNEYTGRTNLEIARKQALKTTVIYYYGPKSEKGFYDPIKATYLSDETIAFLLEKKKWGEEMARSHDIAIIETTTPVPDEIAIAKISTQNVVVGMPIRYGGYGCEWSPTIPSEAPVTSSRGTPPLKYAADKVSSVTELVGFAPNYKGMAKKSLCQGDSGGPVYFDSDPSKDDLILTELVGVNSFVPNPEGKKIKSEGSFQIVTAKSKLGKWISKVLAGSVAPLDKKEFAPVPPKK